MKRRFAEVSLRPADHSVVVHGDIGVHHVHHLCSRIPYYRLPQTLRDNPDLHGASRLTLFQSFRRVCRCCGMRAAIDSVSFRDARAHG